ncbi:phosphotransferase [Mycoplasmopsis gallinarum]|uniref:Choline kinase family n=1 Tax=Mycoplasmopsis gallinarum TaxID=29557 RepID=A0A168RC11_9BACT|nr:phosphotransferase [Mycoplasmopsis gallinarum]OAB48823.1 Choline kinase family [Mycoplasmopsis gallinarum]
MKKPILGGHTNRSFQDENLFIQEKVYTGFNHKINYELLTQFDFVPKLILNNEKEIVWDFINGSIPEMTDENLIRIANNLKILHNSKIKFPASNHAARVKKYREILKNKNINLPVLNDYYRQVNMTLAKMEKSTPLHNDLWPRNMLVDKNNHLYILDWEYATLGDKHFELAYFIEASKLNEAQESLFLNHYENYNYKFILRHKILVNYLVILWAYAQEFLPFPVDEYIQKIYELDKELKNY